MKINQMKVGASLSYMAIFINVITALIYTPFMLRTLGQEEYGVLSLVIGVVANLTVLDFGFGNSIVRYTAKYRAEGNVDGEKVLHFTFLVIYSVIGIVAFIIGIGMTFFVDEIFKSLHPHEMETARRLMIIGVINVSLAFPLSVFGAVIRAYQHHVFGRALNVVKLLIMPFIMISILLFGYGSMGIMYATLFINLTVELAKVLYFYLVIKKRIYISKFDISLIKNILQYSVFIFINIILSRLYWATDQFILGIFAGSAAISVYTIGAQFFNYFMTFSTSMSGVFFPKIVEMNSLNDNIKPLSDLFLRVGRLQLLLLTLIWGGFLTFGIEFITIWAGEDYVGGYYVAVIVMTTSLVPLSQNIGIGIIQARKQHAFRSISFSFIAVLNVILSVILVRPLGVIGCAIATGLATIVGQGFLMNWYYSRKIGIHISQYWKNFFYITGPVVLLVVFNMMLGQFWTASSYLMLFAKIGLFVIEFAGIAWFVTMNVSEKELITKPISKVVKRLKRSKQ